LFALLVLALSNGLPAAAEKPAVITETATPPQGTRSAEVAAAEWRDGIATEMTYATKVEGDLAEGRTVPQEPIREPSSATLPSPSGMSAWVVLLLVLGVLILWLRFGGAGMLLARAPTAQKPPAVAPDAWNITAADQTGDPRRLLDDISAMPDRAAALVRLLRHCLLTAATETDTRLARADTERTACRRLPAGWRAAAALQTILTRAELAHYGGRVVSDAEFALALDQGRDILLKGRAHA
jgi:hypothetical protein